VTFTQPALNLELNVRKRWLSVIDNAINLLICCHGVLGEVGPSTVWSTHRYHWVADDRWPRRTCCGTGRSSCSRGWSWLRCWRWPQRPRRRRVERTRRRRCADQCRWGTPEDPMDVCQRRFPDWAT